MFILLSKILVRVELSADIPPSIKFILILSQIATFSLRFLSFTFWGNLTLTPNKETISKFNIDTEELEFLRLNLEYGHKCRKSFFNNKGFTVGSQEYKNCVLNKGRINQWLV